MFPQGVVFTVGQLQLVKLNNNLHSVDSKASIQGGTIFQRTAQILEEEPKIIQIVGLTKILTDWARLGKNSCRDQTVAAYFVRDILDIMKI
jgi:hypothetical protein